MQRRGSSAGSPEIATVGAWHEALNAGDADGLVKLSDPNVEVSGPRGTGRGAQLLREWMDRANIHLEPRRIFCRANTVVVEQRAQWRSAETGEVTGSQIVATVFTVGDGKVASVLRCDTLADALATVNLDESYEVHLG